MPLIENVLFPLESALVIACAKLAFASVEFGLTTPSAAVLLTEPVPLEKSFNAVSMLLVSAGLPRLIGLELVSVTVSPLDPLAGL